MNRKYKLLLVAGFILALCRVVAAEEHETLDFKASKTIRVELNKSFVFHLEEAATRVSIANSKIADVMLITPKQILIVSKAEVGVTNLIVWRGDENVSAYDVEVFIPGHLLESIREALKTHAPGANVTPALTARSLILDGYVEDQETLARVLEIARSFVPTVTNLIRMRGAIQKAIEQALPAKAEADVTVSITQDGLVLAGTVDSQETLLYALKAARTFSANITNLVQVRGPQQVQVEVTIAEVSRGAMKQLGLGALLVWDKGSFTSGVLGETTSSYGTAFQLMARIGDGQAILNLLQGQGLARTLATPTLVALNGQKAEFLVGGEIPYVTREEIVFREFGIQLKFTPFVTGKESITLKVEPIVSSPDWSFDPPGLKRRSASTVLQLKDGQTFVMAGLLNQELSKITNKIPFLGDLPILGVLFSSKRFLKNESELVILVTPRLVRALNPGEMPPLPGSKLDLESNDTRFFLLNDWNPRRSEDGGDKRNPAVCGPAGFAK